MNESEWILVKFQKCENRPDLIMFTFFWIPYFNKIKISILSLITEILTLGTERVPFV